MYELNLNAQQINDEAKKEFALIPKSRQPMMFESYVTKVSKSGDEYISMKATVLDGEYKNRKIFQNFHLFSSNEKAKEISNKQLAQAAVAVGVNILTRLEQILNKPFIAGIDIKSSPGYNDENTIKFYENINTQKLAVPQQQQKVVTPPKSDTQQFEDDLF